MKKILSIILVFALCIVTLTGCGQKTNSSVATNADKGAAAAEKSKPLAGKHLKVALSANFKYFETVTVDAKGKEVYEGLDIDILKTMSEDLGFTYEIINMPFASLIGALQAKQADFVISGMSYTEERAKSIDFSDKYITAKVGVLKKADSKINSIADLKGKKVACSAGTNYEGIIKKIDGAQLVTFDGQAAITQELLMGRVDASVTGGTAVKKVSEENKELSYFIIDPKDMIGGKLDTYNIGFPKGSELVSVFNKQIADMNGNGKLKALIIKWLGEDYVD